MSATERHARTTAADLTAERQAGLETRQADQDRTLDAMHRLERALSSAAPGREPAWLDDVVNALGVLGTVTRDEHHNASQPDSLLSDIARTQPRLRTRVRGVRTAYQQIRDTIDFLLAELAEPGDERNIDELRRRVGWLLTALRHQRSRESDLLYEAYYEAFHRDVDDDARRQP
jgi:hypothetical protein